MTGTFHDHILVISWSIPSRKRNVSDKSWKENKNTFYAH